MTVKTLLFGLVGGAMCVSCGSGGQQGDAAANRRGGRELRVPQAPLAAPVESAAANDAFIGGTPGAPATLGGGSPIAASIQPPAPAPAVTHESEMLLAPKDAQWTIYCATLSSPDHMAIAKALKRSLIERTGMRNWNIVSESAQSRIYYGFYASIDSKRAREDRRKIDQLADNSGERPFRACQFVQLSAPDPESPPEWNLANVPEDKIWTLMIAAYKDHPDRKKAAVESVRDARARGEEAYYFHGDTVSNVFVGAWPEDAVAEEKVDAKDGVRSQDPLLVLPPGMKVPGKVRRNGKAVRAVGQQLVPVNEELKQKIEQYPHMGVNGDTLVYKQNGRTRVQGPVITPIPHPSETLFGANTAEEPADGGAGFGIGGDPYGVQGYDAGAPASSGSPTSPSEDYSIDEVETPRPARRLRGVGDK